MSPAATEPAEVSSSAETDRTQFCPLALFSGSIDCGEAPPLCVYIRAGDSCSIKVLFMQPLGSFISRWRLEPPSGPGPARPGPARPRFTQNTSHTFIKRFNNDVCRFCSFMTETDESSALGCSWSCCSMLMLTGEEHMNHPFKLYFIETECKPEHPTRAERFPQTAAPPAGQTENYSRSISRSPDGYRLRPESGPLHHSHSLHMLS